MDSFHSAVNWGLVLIAMIQVVTAAITFVSHGQRAFLGIPNLPENFSHYRYAVTALRLSLGVFYFWAAFSMELQKGATFLAMMNTTFEAVSCWLAYHRRLMPLINASVATLGMMFSAALAYLIQMSS